LSSFQDQPDPEIGSGSDWWTTGTPKIAEQFGFVASDKTEYRPYIAAGMDVRLTAKDSQTETNALVERDMYNGIYSIYF
jgi:hypothetical protein